MFLLEEQILYSLNISISQEQVIRWIAASLLLILSITVLYNRYFKKVTLKITPIDTETMGTYRKRAYHSRNLVKMNTIHTEKTFPGQYYGIKITPDSVTIYYVPVKGFRQEHSK